MNRSNAQAMLNQSPSTRVRKQPEPEPQVEPQASSTQPLPVPDSPSTAEACLTGPTPNETLAKRIAGAQVLALDQLALIHYELCLDDPDTRAVVLETLRHAAERELDR